MNTAVPTPFGSVGVPGNPNRITPDMLNKKLLVREQQQEFLISDSIHEVKVTAFSPSQRFVELKFAYAEEANWYSLTKWVVLEVLP